jgi:hypothetical protein
MHRRDGSRRPRRLVLEALETRALMAVGFDYVMAPRFGLDLNRNGLIDLPNTATYAQPSSLSLSFTVVDDPNPFLETVYSWSMRPTTSGGTPVVVQRTAAQIAAGDAPTVSVPAGTYTTTFQRSLGGVVTATVTQPVSVRDILIVSLGDSYSSGEANPEVFQGLSLPFPFPSDTVPYLQRSDLSQSVPGDTFLAASAFLSVTSTALWADGADGFYGPTPFGLNMTNDNRQSHRSTLAATAQYALQLERSDPHTSVTFVHVSQSGATAATTIGATPAYGKEDPSYVLTAQSKLIPAIVGSRPVDQMFVSLGGNDVGFATIAAELLVSNIFVTDVIGSTTSFVPSQRQAVLARAQAVLNSSLPLQTVRAIFNGKLAGLNAGYASVRNALRAGGVQATDTFLTEYPDPTRVFQTFTNPSNGQTFTQPWWGPAIFDILPGASVSATLSYFVSQSILGPLNNGLRQGASANGWTYLGNISSAFLGHGYAGPRAADALGNQRFIRTAREASLYQGPVGLTGPARTSGTLHPNEMGHQAIKNVIVGDLSPSVVGLGAAGGRFASARTLGGGASRSPRHAGLVFAWDFDRLPGEGAFRADAFGRRVAVTGVDPDPSTPGRVATLRVTNRLGLATEVAVTLPGRFPRPLAARAFGPATVARS